MLQWRKAQRGGRDETVERMEYWIDHLNLFDFIDCRCSMDESAKEANHPEIVGFFGRMGSRMEVEEESVGGCGFWKRLVVSGGVMVAGL